jgi:zinc transport system ATP-binding protein
MKHVTFRRGSKIILDDITFCIDQGVFLGVIGPNGGGKTTLLKLILGALPIQEGQIKIFGHELANIGRDRAMIGYVPQRMDVDQNFPATALDVVLMGAVAKTGLFRKIPSETRDRARAMLQRVELDDLRNRPIGRMSGGQQQRAYIARALINEPRLLILDEPTVGLDSTAQTRFLHLIQELRTEMNLTVIMVSHDVGQLSHYADQIACLNRKLHWHDRTALLTDHILNHVYTCELDAYKERVKEIATS